ncbi:allantoinase AllB [Microlunatus capsulatus]|uniref:allantoinase n=1 Tax=Microlunatus capsulatus TaxID=99117 RepID=A0ABS4Z851_9ACTN|nr:allantoinase AllB [Microlunatus capsulatus]MBP2416955.1 allantoinase [Microlunatus capsulatus]
MSGPAVDLEIRGRVLTDDGVVLRRVAVSGGRVVTLESLSGLAPTVAHDAGTVVVELADDEVLLPGLVDTHVHVNEPGRTAWEGFATATRAAAAGGVTTLLDMPLNSIPATTDVGALEVKRAAAEGAVAVDVGFWGGAVPASLGHLAALHAAGAFGFKCFLLDSGVPEFPALSTDQLHAAMTEIAAFDGLLLVHAEDPDVIAAHAVPHTTRYAEFLASRPPEAEVRAVETVLAAARATGCRTHVVHLSAADALPALAAARADGVRVTVETCPHYLTLAAEDVADGWTPAKCCPPVRGAANADRLWQGLVDGVIDVVVSDHSPATADLKLLGTGDFGAAWGGIASLQLGLPLVWTAARARGVALEDVVRWMSTGPADLVGLADRGRVAVGARADLVVLAPEEELVVDVARLRHRNPVSPYDGARLRGVVRRTYLAGRPVTDDTTAGRLVRREETP